MIFPERVFGNPASPGCVGAALAPIAWHLLFQHADELRGSHCSASGLQIT